MAKKKRRLEAEAEAEAAKASDVEPRNELLNGGPRDEPKKRDGKKKRRESGGGGGGGESRQVPTVSIAVAGSIIDNAQSYELATRVPSLSH